MKNNKQKKGDLGQHWTPQETVDFMWNLVKNKSGSFLEPSAGNGSFVNKLLNEGVTFEAIEYDKSVIPPSLSKIYQNKDFFVFDTNKKFDVIIGNPPYVNGKLIEKSTVNNIKSKLSAKTANLYLHFIEKCVVNHLDVNGEIVFIIPSTFLAKTSKGSKLRNWMCQNGAFTDYYEKEVFWENAKVKTCIFKWVKGKKQYKVNTHLGQRDLFVHKGKIKLLNFKPKKVFEDYFEIGVGAAPSTRDISETGVAFIKNKKLVKYDMTNASDWPRYRITSNSHKILFNSGMTRDHDLFYNTVDFGDVKQASRHICSFMIPKFPFKSKDLSKICKVLNLYIKTYKKEFSLVDDNRISLGISECKSLPVDKSLEKFLNTF